MKTILILSALLFSSALFCGCPNKNKVIYMEKTKVSNYVTSWSNGDTLFMLRKDGTIDTLIITQRLLKY